MRGKEEEKEKKKKKKIVVDHYLPGDILVVGVGIVQGGDLSGMLSRSFNRYFK